MAMSGSHDPNEILEPCKILIFSQNTFIRIVLVDANSSLKDFRISRYNFPISRDHVSNHTIVVNSSPCKYLVLNLDLECIPFVNVHNCEVD